MFLAKVEALDPSDPIRGRPKVRLHGWPRAYVWDDYRLAKPKRTTRKADTAHDARCVCARCLGFVFLNAITLI